MQSGETREIGENARVELRGLAEKLSRMLFQIRSWRWELLKSVVKPEEKNVIKKKCRAPLCSAPIHGTIWIVPQPRQKSGRIYLW